MHEFPLTRPNRIRLAYAFAAAPRVDYSIDCVLEDQLGRAFVDTPHSPAAYLIRVGPFHYFAGDPGSPGSRGLLSALDPNGLLMPSASGWLDAARQQFGQRLQPFERYSFSTGDLKSQPLTGLWRGSPYCGDLLPMDEAFLAAHQPTFWSRSHWIDLADFDSPQDFAARGLGFYLLQKGELAGAAWSSLVCSRGIEVSLFVEEAHRRQGMATALSARLVSECLAHGMQPHWDAANPESRALAVRLGYTPAGSYEAHYLAG